MSELDIRRVVIACDSQDEIEIAVRNAADLAARWGVPVHGVFLQNENLRRLAALRFGRPVSLSLPGLPQSLGTEELETLFAALAAGMRRTLASAAEQAGLDWSFAELRDVPSAAGAALDEGDVLVVDAGAGAVAGSWRPRSLWESVACDQGRMVLLLRAEVAGRRRVVLVVCAAGADHDRAFAAARALAQPRDETTLLALESPASASEASLAPAMGGFRPVTSERVSGAAELRRRIAVLDPRLVIIETEALAGDALRAFIAETRCDLLLIG